MFHSKILICLFLLALLSLAPAGASNASPIAQSETLTGVFQIMWGDPAPGSNLPPTITYFLADARGNVTEILVEESTTDTAGGVLALDGRRITLTGTALARPQGQEGPPLFRAQGIQTLEAAVSPEITGSQPWVSIGCKFADVAAEPKTPKIFRDMYTSTAPGLDHYWREQSYNKINLLGSTAVGWFTLPNPKAFYSYSNGELNLSRFADDCTAAADAAIQYRNFVGINLMLNDYLGSYSWGGGYTLNRDGVTRSISTTWLLPWAYLSITAIEHEMGHGFGLAHSQGMYGGAYDNVWDVMSDMWSNCERYTDPKFGCVGQHTIGYHKDRLGWTSPLWIDSGTRTLGMEQLALPLTSNTQVVAIPIGGSHDRYYTVEARRRVGYDTKLPREGVIIHKVDGEAFAVDIDNNGNTGDEGAAWTPGELFADRANGIYVCVNAVTPSGYNVTVGKGSEPPCAVMTPTPKPGAVNALAASIVDLEGNKITSVLPDGWVSYRGDYEANISSPQKVDFSFDVTGPCGVFYSIDWTAQVQPGTAFVLAPGYFNIPDDVCGGQYTVTFGVTYNAASTKSSFFTMLAPTPTPSATATRTKTLTTTPTVTMTPDGSWIYCAAENLTCNLLGTRLARFGANGTFIYRTLTGSFACNAATFGSDPLPGVVKHCAYSIEPNEPTSTSTATHTPTATGTSTTTPTATFTATPTETQACTTKPPKPLLAKPKDGALLPGQAKLKWHAALCAETYVVVVKDTLTNTKVEKKSGLTSLVYKTRNLEPEHAYRWKVIAVNAFGRTSSKWRQMTTE